MKNVTLGQVSDYLEWQAEAACRGMSVELFYDPDSVRGRAKLSHQAHAKSICHTCPVIDDCLARALKVGEPDGVWGGLTPHERDAVNRLALGAPD